MPYEENSYHKDPNRPDTDATTDPTPVQVQPVRYQAPGQKQENATGGQRTPHPNAGGNGTENGGRTPCSPAPQHKGGAFLLGLCTGALGCSGLAFFIFFLLFSLLAIGMFSCSQMFQGVNLKSNLKAQHPYQEELLMGVENAPEQIVVIDVNGIIVSQGNEEFPFGSGYAESNAICEKIKTANNDLNVLAIIINLNTPGGEVGAADMIYREIKNCHKPVISLMNALAASGGYYIAAGTDYIIADKYTLTGSIGVIMEAYNYKDLMDKIGVKAELYTSGKMKAMLAGSKETSQEEKDLVNELIRNTYLEFAKIVADGRNMKLEQVTGTTIGDGRIFDGVQALELGLVDQLGYLEDAVAYLTEQMPQIRTEDIRVVRYADSDSLSRFFSRFMKEARGGTTRNINFNLNGTKQNFAIEKGKLYFLPPSF